MIRLQVVKHDSGLFSHPSLSGSSFIEYSLPHNKGRRPDHISISFDRDSEEFTMLVSRSETGGQFLGYDLYTSQQLNQTNIRVFNAYAFTRDMRIELFWYQ